MSQPTFVASFTAVALISLGSVGAAGTVTTMDDIEFWVGSGPNETALAIDFDGASPSDESLVWGYRFTGPATGEDMFRAVVGGDERLFAKISTPGGFGISIFGIGYDANDDGAFGIDDGTSFDSMTGIAAGSGAADGAQAVDEMDFYEEGFFDAFWHLGVSEGNPFDGGSWASAGTGVTGVVLADGDWLSLAYDADFSLTDFAENPVAAPVPEPPAGPLLLAAAAMLSLLAVRRRGRDRLPPSHHAESFHGHNC